MIRLALLGSVAALAALAPPASAGIWTEIPSGTTQNITAIEYQSASRLWFTTAAGAIFTRSADGSFAQTRAPGGVALNDVEFSGSVGFAAGDGGLLLRSADAGASWTKVALPNASDCKKKSVPIGDINAIRFAGPRVWLFGSGQGILRSDDGSQWADANQCRISAYNDSGFADGFFASPDVGYIVEGDYSKVFFTSNGLASAGVEKAGEAGNAGTPGRVLAGDPVNPNRMWSVNGQPYGRSTTAFTRDGWQTSEMFRLGNPSAREFPATGASDVDYAGGTVLAAGDAGLVLQSVDGETFFYNGADGALATWRWNAAGLASAAEGAVGGDGGRLALTASANALPAAPVASPVPTPVPTATPAPPRADTAFKGLKVRAKARRRVSVRGTLVGLTSCAGSVSVSARGVTHKATLKPACTFSRTFTVRGRAKKLVVTVRFAGNTMSKPTSRNVTVRVKR